MLVGSEFRKISEIFRQATQKYTKRIFCYQWQARWGKKNCKTQNKTKEIKKKRTMSACILRWQPVKISKSVKSRKKIGFRNTSIATLLEMGYGISKFYVLILHFVQIIYFINNMQKTPKNLLQKLLIFKRDTQ